MKKSDILKILGSRLEKNGIEEKDMILEWIDELVDEPEQKKEDIVIYTEKLYEKKYPGEFYIERPIPPKLRIEVQKFQQSINLSFTDYKKYAEWLVEICPKIVNRKTVPYDLCNKRIYEQFKKRRNQDTEIIEKKKSLSKNRLLKI